MSVLAQTYPLGLKEGIPAEFPKGDVRGVVVWRVASLVPVRMDRKGHSFNRMTIAMVQADTVRNRTMRAHSKRVRRLQR